MMRFPNRRGQFIPILGMLVFTSVVLLVAVSNIYKISKAKLEVQNMADAAALAIAALEAKAINVVVDRNESLNHLYEANARRNPNQLPEISNAHRSEMTWDRMGEQYARLVGTINQAQYLFASAYNRFLGADAGSANGTPTQNSGVGSLSDILHEIDGFRDPNVQVFVYNTQAGEGYADTGAEQLRQASESGFLTANGGDNIHVGQMAPVNFEPVDVKVKDKGVMKSLASYLHSPTPIGWMRPIWQVGPQNGIQVKLANGEIQQTIGAGAIVVKRVRLMGFGRISVKSKSVAYVVRRSGVSTGDPHTPDIPPAKFKPTFYVQLAGR